MKVGFKVDNLTEMSSALADFAEFLRGQQFRDDDVFASRLVSCELITNVIRHGGDEAEFTGMLTGDRIIITVTAESLKGVDISRPAPDVFAESGRGLYIVKSICCELVRGDNGQVKVVIKRH